MVWNIVIILCTVAAMEGVASLAHRYIMHGWGWSWHRSHHMPRRGWFETNDLYAVVFAALAIALIAWGAWGAAGCWPLQWIGTGMTLYGVIYFLAHDGLVHQRWPFRYVPRRGYLRRLYLAHRLHHAVNGKEGAVSFGFLYAPPVAALQHTLRIRNAAARAAKVSAPDVAKASDPEVPGH